MSIAKESRLTLAFVGARFVDADCVVVAVVLARLTLVDVNALRRAGAVVVQELITDQLHPNEENIQSY
jgi:hypothetical protein